jgi:hypothetical protein
MHQRREGTQKWTPSLLDAFPQPPRVLTCASPPPPRDSATLDLRVKPPPPWCSTLPAHAVSSCRRGPPCHLSASCRGHDQRTLHRGRTLTMAPDLSLISAVSRSLPRCSIIVHPCRVMVAHSPWPPTSPSPAASGLPLTSPPPVMWNANVIHCCLLEMATVPLDMYMLFT